MDVLILTLPSDSFEAVHVCHLCFAAKNIKIIIYTKKEEEKNKSVRFWNIIITWLLLWHFSVSMVQLGGGVSAFILHSGKFKDSTSDILKFGDSVIIIQHIPLWPSKPITKMSFLRFSNLLLCYQNRWLEIFWSTKISNTKQNKQ